MSREVYHVLVVDDDAMFLELVERALRKQGFEITTSSTALGVTNLVRETGPDVVLLDVNIPALSGDTLLSVARRQAQKQTRFVLFSSCDESKLRALANKVGADGYISKSIGLLQLGDSLKKIIKQPQR